MPSSCSVVGCAIRPGRNKLSQIRVFRFPRENERKSAWIRAMKRPDGWTPKVHNIVCSSHFLTGKPADCKDHPDWVPSVFADTGPIKLTDLRQSLKRFERRERRCQPISISRSTCTLKPPENDSNYETVPASTHATCPAESKYTMILICAPTLEPSSQAVKVKQENGQSVEVKQENNQTATSGKNYLIIEKK